MKNAWGSIGAVIILIGVVGYLYITGDKPTQNPARESEEVSLNETTETSSRSGEIKDTIATTEVLTKVSGKLCYPSEFLPSGKIEAKNVQTGEIISQVYPGSQNGGQRNYSLELKPGTYNIRYFITETSSGYHTTVCPTGLETTCGDQSKRIIDPAKVDPGSSINNHDLCDFYYAPTNRPDF